VGPIRATVYRALERVNPYLHAPRQMAPEEARRRREGQFVYSQAIPRTVEAYAWALTRIARGKETLTQMPWASHTLTDRSGKSLEFSTKRGRH
jgi:hypothetical protein